MNEKLSIKNFGPIKHASLDIRRYSIFIGSQASGKSTVAKLMAIFKDVEFINKNCEDYQKKFNAYNIGNFFEKNTEFEFKNDQYQVKFARNNFIVTKDPLFVEKMDKERERVLEMMRNIVKNNKSLSKNADSEEDFVQRLYEANWKSFFEIGIEPTYVPAERMLLSLIKENPFSLFNNFALPDGITNFGLKFEQAKRSFPIFEVDFLGITFKIEDGKQRVYYSNTKYVDLSEAASGFQAILPVLLVLKNLCDTKNYSSFIIEEPELSLYPSTQKKMVDFIMSAFRGNKTSGDLIITTHSPYILTAFNILLLAHITGSRDHNSAHVSEIVSKDNWINPDDFNAFYFSEGSVCEIFDRRTNLISVNELDNISEEIGSKLEELMEIYEQETD